MKNYILIFTLFLGANITKANENHKPNFARNSMNSFEPSELNRFLTPQQDRELTERRRQAALTNS